MANKPLEKVSKKEEPEKVSKKEEPEKVSKIRNN